jgi:hypothetical protein
VRPLVPACAEAAVVVGMALAFALVVTVELPDLVRMAEQLSIKMPEGTRGTWPKDPIDHRPSAKLPSYT